MSSVVIDNDVMNLYNTVQGTREVDNIDAYRELFVWLREEGVLVLSRKLLNEYKTSFHQSPSLSGLIDMLMKDGRVTTYDSAEIKKAKAGFPKKITRKFQSTSTDRNHIALVVLSPRKKCLSRDEKLRVDINGLPKVDGIKPEAIDPPVMLFYS